MATYRTLLQHLINEHGCALKVSSEEGPETKLTKKLNVVTDMVEQLDISWVDVFIPAPTEDDPKLYKRLQTICVIPCNAEDGDPMGAVSDWTIPAFDDDLVGDYHTTAA